MSRPITTLFMRMSVDGKISTGAADCLDVDADFPKIDGVRQGQHQYYEIEQTTDLWSLNSGRVLVGGKDTATLIDGRSLLRPEELPQLGTLKLLECQTLEDSYLRLRYQVTG